MNDRITTPRPSDPAELAPSAGRAWADEFILEQRMLDVPGDRIGDALVTIEDHLRESGESAAQAFGDPKAYARELAEASGTARRAPGVGALTALSVLLGLGGLLIAVRGFSGWLDGGPLPVTVGDLIATSGVMALGIVIVVAVEASLRLVVDHFVLAVLGSVALMGALVAVLLLFRQTVFQGAPVVFLVLGLVLVAVSSVLAWADHTEDPITTPGEARPEGSRGRLFAALQMPVITLVLFAFTWVLSLIA